MVAATLADAEKQAQSLVNKWCAGSAVAGLVPGVGLVLTASDFVMAKAVASVFGVTDANVEGTMAALAGSIVGRTAAGVLSFVPGVNAVVAGATTLAVGKALIKHYKTLSPLGIAPGAPPATAPPLSLPAPKNTLSSEADRYMQDARK